MDNQLTHAIIAGMPRSGTTALFRFMAAHPEVLPSRVKELNYFLSDRGGNGADSVQDYQFLFDQPGASARLFLEASPAYTRDSAGAAANIAGMVPDAHVIFVLRDPIDRLYTYFQGEKDRTMRVAAGISFDDYVQIVCNSGDISKLSPDPEVALHLSAGIGVGNYKETIDDFLVHFDPDQIVIVFQEHLLADPKRVMSQLSQFMGIDGGFYDDFTFTSENRTRFVRFHSLYRVGMRLNSLAEPIFNRVRGLRGFTRRIHDIVNERKVSSAQRMNPESARMLAEYYSTANAELRDFMLFQYPDVGLPNWLGED